MPYRVSTYNKSKTIIVDDGVVDNTSLDIRLIGKNYAGYGEAQNTNFVHLLENFASETAPGKPLNGQLWYDIASRKLKFWDAAAEAWRSSPVLDVAAVKPQGLSVGDLWWNSTEQRLYIYNGTDYILIGPNLLVGYGRTEVTPIVVTDTSNVQHIVLAGFVDGSVMFVVSSDPVFQLNAASQLLLSNDQSFITINTGTTYRGKISFTDLGFTLGNDNELSVFVELNSTVFKNNSSITKFQTTNSVIHTPLVLNGIDVLPGTTSVTRLGSPELKFKEVHADTLYGDGSNLTGLTANNLQSGVLPYNRLSGLYNISVTGNSGTVTNGVYTSESYNNPAWITGLAGLKVTAIPNASLVNPTVTLNGVTVALGSSASIPSIDLPIKSTLNIPNTIVERDGAGNFSAGTITASVIGNTAGIHTGNVIGNLTGNVIGNVIGTLTGNITGNAVTVSSVTRTQVTNALGYIPVDPADLTNQSGGNANFANGTFQSLVVDKVGNAEIRFNSRGDTNQDLVISVQNEVFKIYEPDDGDREWFRIDDGSFIGNAGYASAYVYGQQILDASNYTNYVPTKTGTGASGTWPINISGSVFGAASANVLKSGDSMTGFLSLHSNPVNSNHAATKAYVDTINTTRPSYTFRYGANYTVGFTNQVGSFNYNSNYFDIFPPSGKTMSNLLAFIPSINLIYFAGGVNADDSLQNAYELYSDRIRVRVQNTEQRGTPAANWLAIWS